MSCTAHSPIDDAPATTFSSASAACMWMKRMRQQLQVSNGEESLHQGRSRCARNSSTRYKKVNCQQLPGKGSHSKLQYISTPQTGHKALLALISSCTNIRCKGKRALHAAAAARVRGRRLLPRRRFTRVGDRWKHGDAASQRALSVPRLCLQHRQQAGQVALYCTVAAAASLRSLARASACMRTDAFMKG